MDKIYRGMQNGAESIEKNFGELDKRFGKVTYVKVPLKNGAVGSSPNSPTGVYAAQIGKVKLVTVTFSLKAVKSVPVIVATLPVGYRPMTVMYFNSPATNDRVARWQISKNGDVSLTIVAGGLAGAGWISGMTTYITS